MLAGIQTSRTARGSSDLAGKARGSDQSGCTRGSSDPSACARGSSDPSGCARGSSRPSGCARRPSLSGSDRRTPSGSQRGSGTCAAVVAARAPADVDAPAALRFTLGSGPTASLRFASGGRERPLLLILRRGPRKGKGNVGNNPEIARSAPSEKCDVPGRPGPATAEKHFPGG